MKAIVVGCGYIASTHIEAIRRIGSMPAYVVGRDEERIRSFALENDIPSYTADLKEALASDAEIVHICTPPHTHAEIIRACLAAGKHIICEKPLSLDPKEAEELAAESKAAYESKGLVCALCCNVRYYPANREAAANIKATASDGINENIKVISGSYLQDFHIPPHPDGWRFVDELSGGMRALSEIGTHWIDLAYAWTGLRISEVYANLGNWYPMRYLKDGMLTEDISGEKREVASEDTAAISMKFENGAIGTLLLSETAPGHPNDLYIEACDLKTSYSWSESEPEYLNYSAKTGMLKKLCPVPDRTESFAALFREVYAAAANAGSSPARYPTFEDGAYIAAVCSAIKKSAALNAPVQI